jgi:glutamyl-tRNA synthetase
MTKISTVRFAPSPTGRLHVGNIRTAMFNWLFAKPDGVFVLRLDDTDHERSTREFAKGIVEDLTWLGITPDRIERQSDRFDAYEKAARQLRDAGLLYPCYETPDQIERSRKRLMARGRPPVYDRAALMLTDDERAALEAEGRKPHWRFLLQNFANNPFETTRTDVTFDDVYRGEQVVDLASMSDPVLRREDGTWLYTLPSVVDDRDMGITHVIRGGDHVANTGVQIALFRALGVENIPTFGHHNLLTDSEGEGLSKRKESVSIQQLRQNGYEPIAVTSLSVLTGTDKDVVTLADTDALREHFQSAKVSKGPARFNEQELNALNERVLHAMPYSVAQAGLRAAGVEVSDDAWALFRENLTKFSDIVDWAPVIDGTVSPAIEPEDRDFIAQALEELPAAPWDHGTWSAWTGALKNSSGRKGRTLFMPLRKALTGREHGPDMGALLPLIGPELAHERLADAL